MAIHHQAKGGRVGYWLRRLVHMSAAIVPIIYYYYGPSVARWLDCNRNLIVVIILGIIFAFELIRLWFGFTVIGQREHEARQISSFTWSALAIGIVLLFAPDKSFGIPIIWSAAIGDPILGELRRMSTPKFLVGLFGIIIIMLIWLLAYFWLATPWWWALVMGPLTVACEWPRIKWFDDNALMQLVPLLMVLIFQ
jgi:hypothetical protein